MERKKIGEILVEARLISPELLEKCLVAKKDMRLGEFLVRKNILSELDIVKAVSQQLKVTVYDPKKHLPDPLLRELVSESFAFQNHFVPVRREAKLLWTAMLEPTDMPTIDALMEQTGMDVEPLICTEAQLELLHQAVFKQGGTGFGQHELHSDELEGLSLLDPSPAPARNKALEALSPQRPAAVHGETLPVVSLPEETPSPRSSPGKDAKTRRVRLCLTDGAVVEGLLHLGQASGLASALNNGADFLTLSDVVSERAVFKGKARFLLVSRGQIVWLEPLA